MYVTVIKRWLQQILLERIPGYLIVMLENYSRQVGLWNNLQQSTQVYDLLNCGPDSRFVSGIDYNLITSNCQYGAGVNKVMSTLENDNIFLDYEQVTLIHSTYWKVFEGVRQFSRELFNQWRRNRGYILNGIGRPMAVPRDNTHDLLNRFVQSTGHDILVKYVRILSYKLEQAGIPWSPLIIDFHDSACVEVPEEYAEDTRIVFQKTVDLLNKELQGTILLGGTAVVGKNLSETKEPEN